MGGKQQVPARRSRGKVGSFARPLFTAASAPACDPQQLFQQLFQQLLQQLFQQRTEINPAAFLNLLGNDRAVLNRCNSNATSRITCYWTR